MVTEHNCSFRHFGVLGPHAISSDRAGSVLRSSGLKCSCGERANAMVTEGWLHSRWLIAELTMRRVIKAQRSGAAITVWQTRSSFCLMQLRIQAFSFSWLLDDRCCLIYERLPEIQQRRWPKRLSEKLREFKPELLRVATKRSALR